MPTKIEQAVDKMAEFIIATHDFTAHRDIEEGDYPFNVLDYVWMEELVLKALPYLPVESYEKAREFCLKSDHSQSVKDEILKIDAERSDGVVHDAQPEAR